MLKITGRVSVRRKVRPRDLKTIIDAVNAKSVYVGVPEENDTRTDRGGRIGNAALAYIHENGSEAAGVPPRPFITDGIQNFVDSGELATITRGALAKATDVSNLAAAEAILTRALDVIGEVALINVREAILNGVPPPLAERTIEERIKKGNSDETPLYDTRELYNSLDYEVKYKRKKDGAA